MKKPISVSRVLAVGAAAVMALTLAGTAFAGTNNGAPSGSHYNLNIIGVPQNKTADMTGSNGHVIFVPLQGKTQIDLTEGDTFQVIDANGTDGAASFMLPNPDPTNSGVTDYSVYARALGIPGGSAEMQTCAITDNTTVCSQYTLDVKRSAGQSKFENVSKELLYIYVASDVYVNGQLVLPAGRYPLFDDALENYFWSYTNNGLKLLQLRFYPISTTVPTS